MRIGAVDAQEPDGGIAPEHVPGAAGRAGAVETSNAAVELHAPLLRNRKRERAVRAVEAADVVCAAAIAVDLGVESVDRRHRLREPLDPRRARAPRLRVSQRREIRPRGFLRGGCWIMKDLGENLRGGIPQRRGVGHALGVRHRDRKQPGDSSRARTHYILTIPAHHDTPPRPTSLYIKVTHAPYTNLTNGNIILNRKRVLRKRYAPAPAIGQKHKCSHNR